MPVLLGTMCSACAERNAHFVRDVSFGSDVRFAREDAEHITSLCTKGAIHHCALALHHCGLPQNHSLQTFMIML